MTSISIFIAFMAALCATSAQAFRGGIGFWGSTTPSADLTPDAVDWTVTSGFSPRASDVVTISGITEQITLKITADSALFVGQAIEYKKNGGSWVNLISQGGTSNTFTVQSGDTIQFRGTVGASNMNRTITVTNESDGSTVIDTFVFDVWSMV